MKTNDEKFDLTSIMTGEISEQSSINREVKHTEISDASRQERAFLSGMLIQQTDELAKAKQKRKKALSTTTIELNGVIISIAEITSILSNIQRQYESKFPNDVPFFREIYRLNGWDTLNPNSYNKPAVVGKWINEIIYGRFHKDVLPALRIMNPLISGSFIRKGKLYHYLNEEGIKMLETFRDESIELMESCTSWYEFRIKLFKKHKVSYQTQLFRKHLETDHLTDHQ